MIGWYLLKYRKDIIVNLDICTQEEYFSKVKENFDVIDFLKCPTKCSEEK